MKVYLLFEGAEDNGISLLKASDLSILCSYIKAVTPAKWGMQLYIFHY